MPLRYRASFHGRTLLIFTLLGLFLAPKYIWAVTTATNTALAVTAAGFSVVSIPAQTEVALTATVLAGSAKVTPGQVNFCDATAKACTDIHLLGTAQVTGNGTATLKFIPGPGTHSYKAIFKGTNTYAPSTSLTANLTVVAATGPIHTTVGIQASGGQGDYSLLGTVATNGPAAPTGQISFLDTTNANYNLGSATLGPTGSNGISFINSYTYLTPPKIMNTERNYVASADFNGDGVPDIILASNDLSQLILLVGSGDGTFKATTIDNQYPTFGIVTSDFNSDGKADFAVELGDGVIAIYLGNGNGTFTVGQSLQPIMSSSGSFSNIVVGDFNGDGIPDIAANQNETVVTKTGGNCFSGFVNCHVQVYLGNGDGTFSTLATRTPAIDATAMVSADFNGDGKLDLAMSSSTDNEVLILLGNGDGTFSPSPAIAQNQQSNTVASADVNGDGKPDLIIVNAIGATVYLGDGDGTFTPLPNDPALNQQTNSIALADFNGDGILDLVLPNTQGGYTSIFFGRGDGTFIPDAFSPSVALFLFDSIAIADFNGDGQSDIAEGITDNSGVDNPLDQVSVLLAQAPSTAAAYIYNVSPVGTGYHYVDASYAGDLNNSPGVSATVPLLALQVPTNLTLSASPTASAVGQQVILTASLDKFFAQNHYASGIVTFTDNTKVLGTAPVNNSGLATLSVNNLVLGRNNLVAKYPGDINFTASTSAILVDNVTSTVPTTTTLTASPDPAYQNQLVTLTANIASNVIPSGTVIFYDAATSIGTATVSASGKAVLTTSSLAVGTHPLTATFVAGGNFAASTSPTVSEVILPATFTLSLDPSSLTLATGQQGASTIHLTSIGNFAGPLALTFGPLPTYSSATITPATVTLTAGGTSTSTFAINTILKSANDPPQQPGSRTLPTILAASALLLLPVSFTRRKRIARLLTMLAFAALLQTLTGCTNLYYLVHSVEAGTYQIPITATDANHNSQTATLTLTITP
jgi:hypothetical protein